MQAPGEPLRRRDRPALFARLPQLLPTQRHPAGLAR